MLNIFTIATRADALANQLQLIMQRPYKPIYQGRPGMSLPVIVYRRNRPVLLHAHWGCLVDTATMSLNTLPMDRVLAQSPFNRWIHTQRCLIPANCFFAHRTDRNMAPDDADTFLIRVIQSRVFLMGGLIADTVHDKEPTFLILTTESADILRPLTSVMPVLMLPDSLQAWFASDHLSDVMHLADRSGDHWFDYYAVSSDLITPGRNDRGLLKPSGMSLREREEREHKLKAVNVKQDRFDRRGSKW